MRTNNEANDSGIVCSAEQHVGRLVLQRKAEFDGMAVSEIKRLKALEAENAKLKSWRDQKRPQWGVFPE